MGDLELPGAEDGLAPGRPVVVREWGEAAGRPLLSWPGLNPFGGLHLIEAGPLLAARGFRVLSIAPPGGGDTPALSEPEDYLPTCLARLAVGVADERGVDRFAFVGWSWGASIGVHMARFRAAVPHAEVKTLDTGHDLIAEAPAETAGLVAGWLESVLVERL